MALVQSPHGIVNVPSVLERLASFPTALPVSLQLSLLRVAFAMPSQCSPLKFSVAGASLLSLELPRLPRSFAVFRGVPQSLPELLLVRWSCCYSLRAPCPRSSSEILCEASPVFGELSCCLLCRCYCIIASQFRSFTPMLSQSSP